MKAKIKSDLIQYSLFDQVEEPSAAETVGISEKEQGMRDKICKEWRICPYGETCMDDTINLDCICFKDEPDKLPLGAFSKCQMKVLSAGFPLVRYTRNEKKIEITEADPVNGWAVLEPFPTFAAAERKLRELKDKGHIETGVDGKIIMSGWNQPGGLLKAGFEFYRCYGLNQYDQGCCIKHGSKNWSNWGKYGCREELKKAWDDLMINDPKALEG
jgi:hypothetical protein